MTKARTLADNFAADINGITAGTGITGGGTSGTVTITNQMATTIDAKGDLVVGTGADAFGRLAVASTAGYVLTVDSAETTGLKWAAAPAASGPAFSATRTSNQSISASTSTKIQVNVETFDTDACYDPTTNYRFTPNKAGYYLIQGWLRITHSSGGSYTQLALHKNGNHEFYYFIEPDQLNGGSWGGDYLMYFNGTTDYVELYAYSAGTDPNVAGVVFSGTWIRS